MQVQGAVAVAVQPQLQPQVADARVPSPSGSSGRAGVKWGVGDGDEMGWGGPGWGCLRWQVKPGQVIVHQIRSGRSRSGQVEVEHSPASPVQFQTRRADRPMQAVSQNPLSSQTQPKDQACSTPVPFTRALSSWGRWDMGDMAAAATAAVAGERYAQGGLTIK